MLQFNQKHVSNIQNSETITKPETEHKTALNPKPLIIEAHMSTLSNLIALMSSSAETYEPSEKFDGGGGGRGAIERK